MHRPWRGGEGGGTCEASEEGRVAFSLLDITARDGLRVVFRVSVVVAVRADCHGEPCVCDVWCLSAGVSLTAGRFMVDEHADCSHVSRAFCEKS